ncbi:MAG TPA: hypothetical protein VIE43_04760 [Thermoanaerobaculia bacterium]|jgi:hypothetical protein|nr:hypothetical protein [Thermoanaerobaculia bacterium]
MKKTIHRMNLSRETLRCLTGGVVATGTPIQTTKTNPVTIPSCIDGCPSAMCPPTIAPPPVPTA